METDDDKFSQIAPPDYEGEKITLRSRSRKRTFIDPRKLKKVKTFIINKLFTFYNMHLLYIFSIAIVGSIIIYALESKNPRSSPRYIDVLFNSISAVCCCGLNASDISVWRSSSLVVVILMTELGCLGFSTCIIVPIFRGRRAKKLEKIRRENYFDVVDDYVKQNKEFSSDDDDYNPYSISPNAMMTNINTDERDISCKVLHKNQTTNSNSSSSSSSSKDVHFDEKDEKDSNNGGGGNNNNNNDKKNGSNTNNNDNDANNTGSSSGDDPIHSVSIIRDRPRNTRSISPALVANTSSGGSSKNTCTTPLLVPGNEDQDEWDSDSDQSHFTETLKFTSTFSRSPKPEGDSGGSGIRRRNKKSRRNEPKSMGLNYNYGMEKEGDKWLVIIILCYTVITQLAGFCLFLFFSRVDNNMKTAIADHDDRSGMFWLFFMSVTSFTNLGFNFWSDGLNNNNLSKSPGLVLTMSILILSGNTCIPIFVRFWVWMCRNLSSQRNKPKYLQSLREILKQPHRYSMHLFSSAFTRVLICVYAVLWLSIIFSYLQSVNGWGNFGYWLEAILISISSRAGGFSIIDMRGIKMPVLFFILGSMFVSAYPIAMIRKQDKAILKEKLRKPRSKMTVLTKYWKGVALNSILWIYLGLIVLCYNEYSDSRPYKKYMDPFSLLFELVSAYGTIGYSLGYEICESVNATNVNVLPGVYNGNATSSILYVSGSAVAAGFEPGDVCYGAPVSLAGAMKPLSKIVLMMTMLAGRHRGLPSHLYHKDMREGVKQQTKLVDLGV